MEIFCVKKICKYNDACCVKQKGEVFACIKENIMINEGIECDMFVADYNKLSECSNCLSKKGLATLDLDVNRQLRVNIKRADVKDFKKIFINKPKGE